MAVANVQGYLTSDNKFFLKDKKAEADAHEAELQFRAWCSMNICRGGEWSAKMVADEILEHWTLTPRT
mgnify:CR=1 FL=1